MCEFCSKKNLTDSVLSTRLIIYTLTVAAAEHKKNADNDRDVARIAFGQINFWSDRSTNFILLLLG